jgi:hypothetical protein
MRFRPVILNGSENQGDSAPFASRTTGYTPSCSQRHAVRRDFHLDRTFFPGSKEVGFYTALTKK